MAYPGKPTIYNLILTNAGQEYSQAIPEYVNKITIKCRTTAALQLAFALGDSSLSYLTIPAGQAYSEDGIGISGTIYLQSLTAGVVAEILTWSGA